MFAANPQGLQQRYAMNQDLLDLLALQKLKKDKEAAQRSLQMQMQPESGTVKDQLEGQMMQATKQEVAASLAPGLQQQGQMMQAQQMQQAMGGGVASQPAPNMVGMARGGIVGYAPGGNVQAEEVPYSMNALRAFDERRRLERELRAAGLAEEEARALAQDPASAQNVLRSTMNVRNMPSEAPKGIESVLSEGTPARDIPVSMDALRRFDERREGANPPANIAELRAQMDRIGSTPRAPYTPLGPDAALARSREEPPAQRPYTPLGPDAALARSREEPSAGLGALVAPRVAPMRQGTEKDLAAMMGEDVSPMQRAAPTAPTDPRMSRYETQLARLEAEETDKLGALIAFLQGAGASGGTNLGATLMGGGSGIQVRDARIRDEMTQTLKNIETLQLEREKMTSEDERARLSRENQLAVANVQSGAQRPTDTTQMVEDYTAYIMAQNPGMSEVEARYKAREQIQADELARATAASGARLPLQESTLLTDLLTQAQESALEYLSSQGNFRPTSQEIDTETNRQYKALLIAAGMDPEQDQSTVPQGQRPPLESMFKQ
jgi:hypothetical protein